jgi:PIN domain nuclease of toxin-antitoxin system
MKYLIDTQILIWFESASIQLKPSAYKILTDGANEIFVSQINMFANTKCQI